MNDKRDRLAKWAKTQPKWRRLKAHAVHSDGSHKELDCEGIYVEFDQERGLLIMLHERSQNEGIGILSQPEMEIDPNSFKAGEGGMLVSAPARSSHLVLRSGGGNLFYISPVATTSCVLRAPDEAAEHGST